MTEAHKPQEQRSPQELQREFRQFYELLPRPINDQKVALVENQFQLLPQPGMVRRIKGESLSVLKQKLSALISQAPITPSFRNAIISEYETSYVFGELAVGGEDPKQANTLHSLNDLFPTHFEFANALVLDDEESNGIFDSETAKKLEAQAYQDTLRDAETSEVFFSILLLTGKFENFRETMDMNPDKEKERLRQWRLEFTEKYGEEPYITSTLPIKD